MGVDFISTGTRTFKKGWDRAAAALATPDLFRPQPSSEAREIQGDVVVGVEVKVGESLTVCVTDGIVAYRHDGLVAEFVSPPAEVVQALQEGCGIASDRCPWRHRAAISQVTAPPPDRLDTLPRAHRLHDDSEKYPLAIGCHF
jgi:hypothetical protein